MNHTQSSIIDGDFKIAKKCVINGNSNLEILSKDRILFDLGRSEIINLKLKRNADFVNKIYIKLEKNIPIDIISQVELESNGAIIHSCTGNYLNILDHMEQNAGSSKSKYKYYELPFKNLHIDELYHSEIFINLHIKIHNYHKGYLNYKKEEFVKSMDSLCEKLPLRYIYSEIYEFIGSPYFDISVITSVEIWDMENISIEDKKKFYERKNISMKLDNPHDDLYFIQPICQAMNLSRSNGLIKKGNSFHNIQCYFRSRSPIKRIIFFITPYKKPVKFLRILKDVSLFGYGDRCIVKGYDRETSYNLDKIHNNIKVPEKEIYTMTFDMNIHSSKESTHLVSNGDERLGIEIEKQPFDVEIITFAEYLNVLIVKNGSMVVRYTS